MLPAHPVSLPARAPREAEVLAELEERRGAMASAADGEQDGALVPEHIDLADDLYDEALQAQHEASQAPRPVPPASAPLSDWVDYVGLTDGLTDREDMSADERAMFDHAARIVQAGRFRLGGLDSFPSANIGRPAAARPPAPAELRAEPRIVPLRRGQPSFAGPPDDPGVNPFARRRPSRWLTSPGHAFALGALTGVCATLAVAGMTLRILGGLP